MREFRYVDQLSTAARIRGLMRRFTREEGIPNGRLVEDFGGSPRLVASVTERSTEVYLRVGRKLATLVVGPADATAEGIEVRDRPEVDTIDPHEGSITMVVHDDFRAATR